MKSVLYRGAGLAVAATLVLAGCASGDSSSSTSATSTESASASASATAVTTSAGCTTTPGETTSTDSTTEDAGTSDADLAEFDKVTVSGKSGKQPTVKLDGTPSFSDLAVKVLSAGSGKTIKKGQKITVNIYQVAADTGEATYNSYTSDPEELTLTSSALNARLLNAFVGQKVGARLILGAPGTEADETTGTSATAASVAVIDVVSTEDVPDSLARATGKAVDPVSGLPTVALDDTGKPIVTIAAGYTAPTELVSQVLIQGDGATVKDSDTITAHYSGWLFDCTQFDSSWDRGEPSSFSLSGVISGWTQGLAGQKVGSQVLLVIPADLAYGDSAQSTIPANSPLIFVVDILGIDS
ncbi:FKBP-type peptidyl-prolyl cis-trans isomerase [Rarobacter incanus]|uniref:peptidylprolyl isomerase n=1 Tax=Rarobacter incanus TaxID=153494 RepID=A0A542SRI8_9MICO|nr:FKBP-type peptidyl-prolyl cis-trans isomerase [Rarobacter incanus]TQK77222.1 peptidylprolyl isomerase [Rarobacter incanus]